MSTLRGRPPRVLCWAGGIIGSTMAHCASVRSDTYFFRDWFSLAIFAHSPAHRICANYLRNLLFCKALFPDSLLEGPPPGRSGLPPLPTLEDQPSKPPVSPILPPLPPVTPGEPQQLPQRVRVLVRQIRIVGNTVFPMEKLLEVTQRYVNRELATEDLEALRIELTRLYIDAGYINSGAIIPDQKLSEGVITLQIIEGELSTIEISGTTWFRDSYIRNRIALGAGPPLNIVALQERLQFLQQDERIARLAAELRPGVQRGESALLVKV